jgi:FkbM family methyltransferase
MYLRLGSSDGPVLKEIFLWDEYGALIRGVSGDVRTILDLGSNIGLTVRLWQAKFPGARVCAVEPDESNCSVLTMNAAAAPMPEGTQPTIVRACVAGKAGFVTMDRSGAEWGLTMKRDPSAPATERVEAITMGDVLCRAGFESGEIDILKCDIEGAEAEVFAGECAWLSRVRHLAIEVHEPYAIEKFLSDVERIAPGRFRVTHQVRGSPNSLVFMQRV